MDSNYLYPSSSLAPPPTPTPNLCFALSISLSLSLSPLSLSLSETPRVCNYPRIIYGIGYGISPGTELVDAR